MVKIILLLLIAVCWGLPTLMIMFIPEMLDRFPNYFKERPGEKRMIMWMAGIGYPLGLILFIIFINLLN